MYDSYRGGNEGSSIILNLPATPRHDEQIKQKQMNKENKERGADGE